MNACFRSNMRRFNWRNQKMHVTHLGVRSGLYKADRICLSRCGGHPGVVWNVAWSYLNDRYASHVYRWSSDGQHRGLFAKCGASLKEQRKLLKEFMEAL